MASTPQLQRLARLMLATMSWGCTSRCRRTRRRVARTTADAALSPMLATLDAAQTSSGFRSTSGTWPRSSVMVYSTILSPSTLLAARPIRACAAMRRSSLRPFWTEQWTWGSMQCALVTTRGSRPANQVNANFTGRLIRVRTSRTCLACSRPISFAIRCFRWVRR